MENMAQYGGVLWFSGGVAVCLAFYIAARIKAALAARRKRHKGKAPQTGKGLGGMDKILIILGTFLLCFITAMIVTYWVKGGVPDTLIQYTLGAGGVEALLLAGIKISKVVTGDKSGEREDREMAEGHDPLGMG